MLNYAEKLANDTPDLLSLAESPNCQKQAGLHARVHTTTKDAHACALTRFTGPSWLQIPVESMWDISILFSYVAFLAAYDSPFLTYGTVWLQPVLHKLLHKNPLFLQLLQLE
jgi:hypothetical protein